MMIKIGMHSYIPSDKIYSVYIDIRGAENNRYIVKVSTLGCEDYEHHVAKTYNGANKAMIRLVKLIEQELKS